MPSAITSSPTRMNLSCLPEMAISSKLSRSGMDDKTDTPARNQDAPYHEQNEKNGVAFD
jgi:hypothetical protein